MWAAILPTFLFSEGIEICTPVIIVFILSPFQPSNHPISHRCQNDLQRYFEHIVGDEQGGKQAPRKNAEEGSDQNKCQRIYKLPDQRTADGSQPEEPA